MSRKKKLHPEIKSIKNICDLIEEDESKINPPQHQKRQPGLQNKMHPKPISIYDDYKAAEKLKNKVVVITGGDSGIGRAVAYHSVKEGAKVAFIYLDESADADTTLNEINEMGGEAVAIKQDLSSHSGCKNAVKACLNRFGEVNVLINNIAVQYPTTNVEGISPTDLEKVFATNVFSYFFMIQELLPHLKKDDVILNTTSITAFRGSEHLIDYSATKGAIVSLTRSLATLLIKKGIRVNGVAPGPVWTPLIPASFSEEEVAAFGSQSPMNKPAQPADIAPTYIFLASKDSQFITGQILHPNGGELMV
ncbi:SDR family oxidoreductase [Legionella impletisoli]|uniref:NAD(P)-dependent oxidoreductase n=1 Tax=Legionella impletisoli TaxID=343510 RepID=A0A917JYL4_9GAMM|nr:SDR family oxidoreductase [Legionella impletisoli]GGI90106.1 NAD(P)-dependent oxidoreductase [Legionella impletisoli]